MIGTGRPDRFYERTGDTEDENMDEKRRRIRPHAAADPGDVTGRYGRAEGQKRRI